MTTPIEVVSAVIKDQHGRVLMGRRKASDALPNAWEFPGGKVDPGEGHSQALVREILEETGLDIVVERRLYAVTVAKGVGGLTYHVTFYRCRLDAPRLPVMYAHDALGWFDRPHVVRLEPLTRATRSFIYDCPEHL